MKEHMSEQAFPTSFGQRRLWFLEQVVPGTAAYNLARAFRLTGSLNRSALAKALQSIISRHDSLRTIFFSEGDEVQQVVLSSLKFDLPASDISDLPPMQREQTALRLAAEEAGKPFDLAAGPLLRAKLLKLEREEHILVLAIHHIISDGWSMNLLFHEMGELYAQFAADRQPVLPKLSFHYSDYSRWQRESLNSGSFEPELSYWKNKLKGAETVLKLPTDHPRLSTHSGRGKSIHFELSREINKDLNSLAQSENATLFMVLVTVFQILLGRYALQHNFLIGTPTAGRNDVELENLIGFFVNTLILRADLNQDKSFREVLREVRINTLEALSHQNVPFEKLVEALEPDRSLNRNPLFQVMFILQNTPKQEVELPGILMQEIEFESGIAKFDLTLEIIDLEDLYCTFEYDSDLYDEITIRRMAGHFAKLTEAIVGAPDEKLSKFSLVTVAEVQQFAEWNSTAVDYRRELCVHTAFEQQVERTPEATALIDGNKHLTFRELNDLADRMARLLSRRGAIPGMLVGVSLNRSVEMIVALLGILKTGAAYVPLDPAYPEERLDFMVRDSQIRIVATTQEFLNLWQKHDVEAVAFDVESLSTEIDDRTDFSGLISSEDRMYVIYTSGSTGTPKGVEGTHRASINRFSWMWETYPFAENEICCQKTFLGFVDSIWEIFGPLLRGVPSVILSDEAILDPTQLVSLLSSHAVTRIVLVPSLLRIILDVEDLQSRLPKLKLWTCSGELLPLELVDRFTRELPKAMLLNIYGSSEVAADVTWHEVTENDARKLVPIGKPISNVQTFIFDSHLNQVPVGVPGEIHIGGDCLAKGYFNRPGLTSERFITHHFETGHSARLFKTGDLGRYLPTGELEYLGRTDNQVKIRGMRVELGEIEAVLATHPVVRNAIVILGDRSAQQRLVAYLEIRPGLYPDDGELRRFMRSKLPNHMIPADYLVVDAFPLLASGKVDRRTLSTQTATPQIGGRRHIAPQTQTEEILASIWRSLLKVENVGVTDNFFELGGHSLMVMQVVARIRKEFDVEVPIRSLFEDPTIRGLAKEVEDAKIKGIKASPPISSFRKVRTTHDLLRQQVDQMSREELEELLRQVLKEKSIEQ